MDLNDAYKVLELPVGASRDAVREAYRDLLKVWHPDRHASDPPLQKRAEERLKRIVAAFEVIEQNGFPSPPVEDQEQRGGQVRAEQAASTQAPPWEARAEQAAATAPPWGTSSQAGVPFTPGHANPSSTTNPGSSKTATRVIVGILMSVVAVGIWAYYDEQSKSSESYASSSSYSSRESYERPTYSPPVEAPSDSSTVPVQEPKPLGPPPFTLGSTRAQVETAQGTPTSVDKDWGETWWYQGAQVKFAEGRVSSWSSAPYTKLNVSLAPKDKAKAEAAIARGTYTLGSTKDEVLAIQGTPNELDVTYGETWWYGASTIRFSSGRVYAWDIGNTGPELKVDLRPRSTPSTDAAAARGYYGASATKDEVLAVEGTPREIDKTYGETWWYGASTLKFSDGRISGYDSDPMHPLKLRLKTEPDADRTVESTTATLPGFMNVVIKIMDKAGDDICACDSLTCAKQIASAATERGFQAGSAYTKDRVPTAELKAFYSTMTTDDGTAFLNYVKEHYDSWYSRFGARVDGCITRLKTAGR